MNSARAPSGINRRGLLATAATLSLLFAPAFPIWRQALAQTDPLPSWNDGPSKQAITGFVARVTTARRPGFRAAAPSASPRSTTTARCGSSIRCTPSWPSPSTA